jgi:membrane-associated protein
MDLVSVFIEFVLHLDVHLAAIILAFGAWTYLILFAVVFCETGLVVFPFLPGDSLLFAAGALSAIGAMNVFLLFFVFSLAAIAGDTVNYWIGSKAGLKLFRKGDSRFFKKEYLEQAQEFYARHGKKTIVLARFVPIIRTFAPFVAGMAKMPYHEFIAFNVFGGILWVALFLFGGYFFGNIPIVKENFSLAIIAIIVVSLMPAFFTLLKGKKEK